MGLFGGNNNVDPFSGLSPSERESLAMSGVGGQNRNINPNGYVEIPQYNSSSQIKKVKKNRNIRNKINTKGDKGLKSYNKAKFGVGREVGFAVNAGRQQQANFSQEQEMLQQMFGGGEHIWGNEMDPVKINHDLHPSQRDPYDETASMFGFGGGR